MKSSESNRIRVNTENKILLLILVNIMARRGVIIVKNFMTL